jgi:hypothetical protein
MVSIFQSKERDWLIWLQNKTPPDISAVHLSFQATQKAETRSIVVMAQTGQKSLQDPILMEKNWPW